VANRCGIIGLGSVGNVWSDVIVGIIVAVLGFAMASTTPAHGISTGILGLWMIFSAFIPGLRAGAGARWDHIIVGVILAIAGFSTLEGWQRLPPIFVGLPDHYSCAQRSSRPLGGAAIQKSPREVAATHSRVKILEKLSRMNDWSDGG
jgi:hypothetical protein